MTYLSIMMAAVKTTEREAYLEHARAMWPLFKKYGAISTQEQWGRSLPEGKRTSFPLAVQLEDDETVVVGWIIWPDEATHDRAWQSLAIDPDMADMKLPFDGSRMIFGGFETVLSL